MSLLSLPARRVPSPGLFGGVGGALPEALAKRPEFRAAIRHSRRVRFLKRAIPLGCLLLFGFLALRTVAGLFLPDVPAGLSGQVSIEDRKIVMDKPKLSGFKRDGSSYELNAERALQDLRNPNMVEMFALSARVQQGRQGWTNLSGENGLYDSKAERLNLRGNVRVRTENGTEALLQEAEIEFKAGTVRSEKPVEVKSPTGLVTAGAMQVFDNGHRLVFEGHVRSEFTNPPVAEKSSSGQATE